MGDFSILAIRIKQLRASLNMTQKEFAKFVGCTPATLSAYENGAKSPSLDIVKTIAEKCKVSIDWLCGLTETKNYDDSVKTYGDAIRLLFRLEEKLDMYVSYELVETEFPLKPIYPIAKISFGNKKMQDFIEEWEKMKDLHDNNLIDDEVYNLWAEKTLKKYKDAPAVGEGWSEN